MAESFDLSPEAVELKGQPKGITRVSKKARIVLGLLLFIVISLVVISSYKGFNVNNKPEPGEEREEKKDEGKKKISTSNFDSYMDKIPDAQATAIPLGSDPTAVPQPGPLPGEGVPLEAALGGADSKAPPLKEAKSGPTPVPPLDPSDGSEEGSPGESPEKARERERKRRLDQQREEALNSGLDVGGNWGNKNKSDGLQTPAGAGGAAASAADALGLGGGLSALTAQQQRPSVSSSSGQAQDDQNKQIRKEAFLREAQAAQDEIYLRSSREAPMSRYQINIGWKIPAALECGTKSDLPGAICAQVKENVYDSKTGKHLLIPQGTKAHGTYDSQVAVGQERILVVWNYLEFRDGSILPLKGMPGSDQAGYAGFDADVDNHYIRLAAMTGMMSLFSAGFQLSQPQTSNTTGVQSVGQSVASTVGQQLGQTGNAIVQRQLQIQPTLSRTPGYRFNIIVTKNIVFPAPFN